MSEAETGTPVVRRRTPTRWNDEQLRAALIGASHYSEVAKVLGLYCTTKNYRRLADRAAVLGLDTSRIDDFTAKRVNPSGPIALLDAFNDAEFADLVASCSSWPEVVARIGYTKKATRANWLAMRRGEGLGLDCSHFKYGGERIARHGFDARKERFLLRLVANSPSKAIGRGLDEFGLRDHRCECCGITEWMGREAPLQLDHVDGDNRNNRLENLRLLCANCHMQTETWGFKNSRRRPAMELPTAA